MATAARSLAEQAYELLEGKLVNLDLPPGAQVSEGQLIESIGLGRTPVREAIQKLAQQELFIVLPRKGLVVTPISRASMLHILETRKPVERVIVYRAALNAKDDQRSEIAAIARKLTISHERFIDALKLDQELNSLLDVCAANPFATAAASPLRSHCRRFCYGNRHQLQLSEMISAITKMARFIARRDYVSAQKASDGVISVLERFVAGMER
jgi:DNA-binding GntR family transcriptional regulator